MTGPEDVVRVLIVDDQVPFRSAASAVVSATWGFVVVGVATSGEESLDLADRLRPDLVLMDVNLPGLSGPAATRRLRALPSPPVVVLVSTYDASEYDDEVATCGASAFLTKSGFGPDALRSVWEAARP